MVTGIEAAGLALAIFPIVVQGLSFYLGGVQKIKDTKDYKGVLKRLVRQLKMEKVKFVNTCRIFLQGIVSIEQVDVLIGGEGWSDRGFQGRLQQHVESQTAEAFIEAVEALYRSLRELIDDIGLDINGEQKNVLKKLRFVLDQQRHKAVLEEVREINTDLEQLTMQINFQRSSRRQHSPVGENYNHIRSRAKNLYGVFQERFRSAACPCTGPHNASLRLQRIAVDRIDSNNLRFKVLFDFKDTPTNRRDWRAFEFRLKESCGVGGWSPGIGPGHPGPGPASRLGIAERAVVEATAVGSLGASPMVARYAAEERPADLRGTPASAPAPIEGEHITDFCVAIRSAEGQCSESYVGMLVDEHHCLWELWSSIPTTPPYITAFVSLENLLKPGWFEKKARLKLGIELASAVMQLHKSEWLSEIWGKREVFFPQREMPRYPIDRGEVVLVQEPLINEPFVRRIFPRYGSPAAEEQTSAEPSNSGLVRYNASLFSLGIVLIELWFEKPIETLQTPKSNTPLNENDIFEIARNCLKEIFTYGGDYGHAVSCCLYGISYSGPGGTGQVSLDDPGFKKEAHANIISSLEKYFKIYTNTDNW